MAYGNLKVDNVIFTNAGSDKTVSISGIIASISGNLTVTGIVQGAAVIGTTLVSGTTVTGSAGSFTLITGETAGFTTVTGQTVTGDLGLFNTLSGNQVVLATSLSIPSGSASSPSINVNGDLNTGLYSPGADQVAISTNGTQRLTVDTAATTSTLPVVHPLGAVGTPSITFTGDLNTGIYSPAADTIAFVEGGAEAARIDSSGRLLVGTSNAVDAPFGTTQGKLIVAGQNEPLIFGTYAANQYGTRLDFIKSRSATVNGKTVVQANDELGDILFAGTDGTNPIAGARIRAEVDGTPGTNDMPGRLVFFTTADGASSPTERMRITSAGRVGIGTDLASELLSVGSATNLDQGDISIGLGVCITGTPVARKARITKNTNSSDLSLKIFSSEGAVAAPIIFNINSTTESARIDSAGRLLVGTSTAIGSAGGGVNNLLQIANGNQVIGQYSANLNGGFLELTKSRNATAGSHTVVQANDQLGILRFSGSDGSAFIAGSEIRSEVDATPGANDMPGRLVFSTTADGASSPTERMRITNAGRVGIGTADPLDRLHIASTGECKLIIGNEQTNTDGIKRSAIIKKADNDLEIRATESAAASATIFTRTVSAESARIDSSGRLLVGTSTARNFNIGVTTPRLQLEGLDVSQATFSLARNSANSGGPVIGYGKSRGTVAGSMSGVFANDDLGRIQFQGADGTQLQQAAEISAHVDGPPGPSNMPGRLVFSTTANGSNIPTERMRIDATGTTTLTSAATTAPFIAKISASEVARIDSSGRLLVGTSTARTNFLNTSFSAALQVEGTSHSASSVSIVRNTTDTGVAPNLVFGVSNSNTLTSNTLVANGANLGNIQFQGNDGTEFVECATISAAVDGTPGANDMPGRIVLSTTADGASSPTERFRITNDGVIAHNQPAPAAVNATATLTVANLKTGIITSTSAAATDMTLPTGTLTEGGFAANSLYDNFTFEWSVINTGPSLVRVLAGTAHTIVGSGSVATGTSGRFATRRTAANTFVTYRLS